MATATAMPNLKVVEETYQHPLHRDEHGLTYHVDSGFRHVVIHYFPAGEQNFPTVNRCETIESARAVWRGIRNNLIANGYERRPHR